MLYNSWNFMPTCRTYRLMEKTIYLINLFDIYGDLFTEKQKEYFIDYYFNNYTLQEISENNNVTRNAIHKSIKETEEKLKSALEAYTESFLDTRIQKSGESNLFGTWMW